MTDKDKRFFDKVASLAIFLAVTTCVQGMFSTGCLVTTLSSIEKRFGKGFLPYSRYAAYQMLHSLNRSFANSGSTWHHSVLCAGSNYAMLDLLYG